MPIIFILAYTSMNFSGLKLPAFSLSILSMLFLFIIFFIAALLEEAGWMGYLAPSLENKMNALEVGLTIGFIWAIWHVILNIEDGHNVTWIFWQFIFTISARIVIIWIYTNNSKSTILAIIFHSMINVVDTLIPINGSYFDPFYFAIFTLLLVSLILILFGSDLSVNSKFNVNT